MVFVVSLMANAYHITIIDLQKIIKDFKHPLKWAVSLMVESLAVSQGTGDRYSYGSPIFKNLQIFP